MKLLPTQFTDSKVTEKVKLLTGKIRYLGSTMQYKLKIDFWTVDIGDLKR